MMMRFTGWTIFQIALQNLSLDQLQHRRRRIKILAAVRPQHISKPQPLRGQRQRKALVTPLVGTVHLKIRRSNF